MTSPTTTPHAKPNLPAPRPRWDLASQQAFLTAYLDGNSIAASARAAGMSREGVYRFRRTARGGGFDAACRAVEAARRRVDAGRLVRRDRYELAQALLMPALRRLERVSDGELCRRLTYAARVTPA